MISKPIQQMKTAIIKKELSSRELVKEYLAKIESTKHLNAIIEINPDALDIAERLDSSGEKDGILHGIPVLLKDNIGTCDKMHTSAGSEALAGNIANIDAPIARLLREAGAVILGKTNMTEFANYMAAKMPNGYSSRGGQTLNFFDPAADPSGSSTGSAVAVTADLCAAAIGTETCGSIISPAQHAGIIGIKPTLGLINNQGIIPISFTLDTAGPMCRYAEDAGIMLEVLSGQKFDIDYSKSTRSLSVKVRQTRDLRIGVCRVHLPEEYDEEWIGENERLIEVFRLLNIQCIELPEHKTETGFLSAIMQYEFKHALNCYLASILNPAIPQSLRQIIAYNENHAAKALIYGQDILIAAEEKASGAMTEPEYTEAIAARENAIRSLDALFTENKIDIIFMTEGDFRIAAATGFPSMTLPIGKTSKGLPIGSFFIAQRYCEDTLLHLAYALEEAFQFQNHYNF